jgi:hypothetical protein
MHRLEFTINTQQKGYYVNGHERSNVVASWKAFCETYLSDIEPRCLQWMQVSLSELDTTHKVLNPEFGFALSMPKVNVMLNFMSTTALATTTTKTSS